MLSSYPLQMFSRIFTCWSILQGLKVILLKFTAKANLWANSPLLVEDANYSEIVKGGYKVKRQNDEILITRDDWNLTSIVIRRYTTDFRVFKLIFLQNEFRNLIEFIGAEKISSVIDAGANIGLAALKLETLYPGARIISIEPDSGNFSALQKNIRVNKLNADAVQSAVWSKPAKLYFDHSFRDGGDWAISVTEKPNDGESILATSFNELMQRFSLRQIDLLKIDIEGSEKEIFAANDDSLQFLSATKFIAVEVHEEIVNPEVIESLLREKGFELSRSGEYLIGRNKALLQNN